MTNHKAIQSIFSNLQPFTVGFDEMFNHLDYLHNHIPHMTADKYPPYNIVKTGSLSYDIEVLTVEQAVMRLELGGLTMLMFRNASHFGLNVVHLRGDGSIGWIDPRGARHLANLRQSS